MQWMDSPVGTIYSSAVYDQGGPKVDQIFMYVFIYVWMFKVGGPRFGGTTDTLTVGTTLLFSL